MIGFLMVLVGLSVRLTAWDYEGHRLVNQLALAALPADFPAFVKEPAAAERIAFLSGEPDRWRNSPDLPFRHLNAPDHYFDVEDLEPVGLKISELSRFRYEFTAQLAAARTANANKLAPIDASKNSDKTRELVGLLPWSITEHYARVKSGFSYLKAFEESGTPEEIENARANVIYAMGILGHYVGDTSQPLHTTKHYNGWVGENPKGYTTTNRFHSWIDGGYLNKVSIFSLAELQGKIRPAKLVWAEASAQRRTDIFPEVMSYITNQFTFMEPLYELEKAGKLSGDGEVGKEGRAFLGQQLVAGGQMLGDLWYTAWKEAPADTFLKSRLEQRKLAKPEAK